MPPSATRPTIWGADSGAMGILQTLLRGMERLRAAEHALRDQMLARAADAARAAHPQR